jgi:hypothetical protein
VLSLDEHQILDLRLILRQLTPGQRTVQLDEKTSLMLSDKLVDASPCWAPCSTKSSAASTSWPIR